MSFGLSISHLVSRSFVQVGLHSVGSSVTVGRSVGWPVGRLIVHSFGHIVVRSVCLSVVRSVYLSVSRSASLLDCNTFSRLVTPSIRHSVGQSRDLSVNLSVG